MVTNWISHSSRAWCGWSTIDLIQYLCSQHVIISLVEPLMLFLFCKHNDSTKWDVGSECIYSYNRKLGINYNYYLYTYDEVSWKNGKTSCRRKDFIKFTTLNSEKSDLGIDILAYKQIDFITKKLMVIQGVWHFDGIPLLEYIRQYTFYKLEYFHNIVMILCPFCKSLTL